MNAIIKQLFCSHRSTLTRRDAARMFTECIECGHCSEGVEIGGFEYHGEVYERLDRTRNSVHPQE